MRLLSVNLGPAREIPIKQRMLHSSILKTPQQGRVRVHRLGLEDDARVEVRKMGAEHHAVYAYPYEHYAHWQQELDRAPFPMGQFGENLTITGLLETDVRIGDVLRIGSCLLQVAHHRIPCAKLDARMETRFASRFLTSGRTGFYLRVLQEGELGQGDNIELLQHDPGSPSVEEFSRLIHYEYWDAQGLNKLLQAVDLMPAWQAEIAEKLHRAEIMGGWPGLRELCIIGRDTADQQAVSLDLKCRKGRPLPPLQPGQQLAIVVGGRSSRNQRRRIYPVSHSPHDPAAYRIHVQRVAGPLANNSECLISLQLLGMQLDEIVLCAMPPLPQQGLITGPTGTDTQHRAQAW